MYFFDDFMQNNDFNVINGVVNKIATEFDINAITEKEIDEYFIVFYNQIKSIYELKKNKHNCALFLEDYNDDKAAYLHFKDNKDTEIIINFDLNNEGKIECRNRYVYKQDIDESTAFYAYFTIPLKKEDLYTASFYIGNKNMSYAGLDFYYSLSSCSADVLISKDNVLNKLNEKTRNHCIYYKELFKELDFLSKNLDSKQLFSMIFEKKPISKEEMEILTITHDSTFNEINKHQQLFFDLTSVLNQTNKKNALNFNI